MNILKILAILVIFVPSFAFAHGGESDVNADTRGVDIEASRLNMERTEDMAGVGGVFCTADAKICDDGTEVGRVPPSCEFAKCPGEAKDENKKNSLDDDSDGDGISDIDTEYDADNGNADNEGGLDIEDGELDGLESVDSFFDVFTDFTDEDAIEVIDAFLKIDDIEGESERSSMDEDGESEDVKSDDKKDSAASSKKPKEIVIVGSKIKDTLSDNKAEVRGWDPEKKEITIKPTEVEEAQDLLDFVSAKVVSDENIEKVSIGPEEIKLEYKQPAKLFGFIPMSLTTKVVLSNKDKLKVKFPWYAFLTSDNAKEIKDEIDVLSLAWGAVPSIGDTKLQDTALKFDVVSKLMKASHDTVAIQ